MTNLLMSQRNIRVNEWKIVSFAIWPSKGMDHYYWYDHIDMIYSHQCGRLTLITCWLSEQSFMTEVSTIDLLNLYQLIWSYQYDMIRRVLTLQAAIQDWCPGNRFVKFMWIIVIISLQSCWYDVKKYRYDVEKYQYDMEKYWYDMEKYWYDMEKYRYDMEKYRYDHINMITFAPPPSSSRSIRTFSASFCGLWKNLCSLAHFVTILHQKGEVKSK